MSFSQIRQGWNLRHLSGLLQWVSFFQNVEYRSYLVEEGNVLIQKGIYKLSLLHMCSLKVQAERAAATRRSSFHGT